MNIGIERSLEVNFHSFRRKERWYHVRSDHGGTRTKKPKGEILLAVPRGPLKIGLQEIRQRKRKHRDGQGQHREAAKKGQAERKRLKTKWLGELRSRKEDVLISVVADSETRGKFTLGKNRFANLSFSKYKRKDKDGPCECKYAVLKSAFSPFTSRERSKTRL